MDKDFAGSCCFCAWSAIDFAFLANIPAALKTKKSAFSGDCEPFDDALNTVGSERLIFVSFSTSWSLITA